MEGNIIIAPPPRVPDLVSPSSPLPFALPNSLCPSSGEQFPFMSAGGGQVGRVHFVDFPRQFLGQNPREGALEWTGLWETLASSPPQRALI